MNRQKFSRSAKLGFRRALSADEAYSIAHWLLPRGSARPLRTARGSRRLGDRTAVIAPVPCSSFFGGYRRIRE